MRQLFLFGGTGSASELEASEIWKLLIDRYVSEVKVLSWDGGLEGRWTKGSVWSNQVVMQSWVRNSIDGDELIVGGFSHGGNIAIASLYQLYKSYLNYMLNLKIKLITVSTPFLREYEVPIDRYRYLENRCIKSGLRWLIIQDPEDPVIQISKLFEMGGKGPDLVDGISVVYQRSRKLFIRRHDHYLGSKKVIDIIDKFIKS